MHIHTLTLLLQKPGRPRGLAAHARRADPLAADPGDTLPLAATWRPDPSRGPFPSGWSPYSERSGNLALTQVFADS